MLFSQTPLLPFFEIRETFVAADTAGNQILQEDWRRIALRVQNIGNNTVFIRPTRAATVGQGMMLTTAARTLELLFKDYGGLVARDWFAISDIMNSDLSIYEVLYTPRQQGEQPWQS